MTGNLIVLFSILAVSGLAYLFRQRPGSECGLGHVHKSSRTEAASWPASASGRVQSFATAPAPAPADIDDPDVRLTFVNVFAIMTEERRESLISMYLRRNACTRTEAMRNAIEDRRKDQDRAF